MKHMKQVPVKAHSTASSLSELKEVNAGDRTVPGFAEQCTVKEKGFSARLFFSGLWKSICPRLWPDNGCHGFGRCAKSAKA